MHIKINRETYISIVLVLMGAVLYNTISYVKMPIIIAITLNLIYVTLGYIHMICNSIKKRGFNNIYLLILVISIFFYYGQHIIAVIMPSYYSTQEFHILDNRIPQEYIIKASFMIMISLLLINIGYSSVIKRDYEGNEKNDFNKIIALRRIAWFFFIISIFPTLKYLLAQHRLLSQYGYLARRSLETSEDYYSILGVSLIEIYISNWFVPSLYALLLTYKEEKFRRIVYVFIIIYCALYYLTGSRFMILKILTITYLISTAWCGNFEKKQIKKYMLIGFLVVFIFGIGTAWRAGKISSIGAGIINIGNYFWESGITFTSISNIMYCCPRIEKFFYGKSYIGAFLQCLPSFLRFNFFNNNSMQISKTFAKYYYGSTAFGYGSSFIAEAYYNLGIFIYPGMVLFGTMLGKIENDLYKSSQEKMPLLFLSAAFICGDLLYGVRNDLSAIPRNFLFSICPIIVLTFIYKQLLLDKYNRYATKNETHVKKDA